MDWSPLPKKIGPSWVKQNTSPSWWLETMKQSKYKTMILWQKRCNGTMTKKGGKAYLPWQWKLIQKPRFKIQWRQRTETTHLTKSRSNQIRSYCLITWTTSSNMEIWTPLRLLSLNSLSMRTPSASQNLASFFLGSPGLWSSIRVGLKKILMDWVKPWLFQWPILWRTPHKMIIYLTISQPEALGS